MLPPSEKRVAEHVVADPEGTAALSIRELGRATATSVATVQRLCRRLGLPGYPALRMALIAAVTQERAEGEADQAVVSDIGSADSAASIIEKIAYADGLAVRETARQLHVASLEAAALAIAGAGRTDVYGVGASAFVAADLQQKLMRIGRTAFSWTDPHMALTSAALLGANDVALAISHTGFTPDTVGSLAQARESGATTIALTNNPDSPVAAVAGIVLTTSARETTFRSGAMASRIAQLVVIDMLFVAVARQNIAATTAALARTRAALSERRG
jgi:DNA-binding MurR/RpiR family transcriptional regulator